MKTLIAFLASGFLAGAALAQALPPLNFDAPTGFSGGGEEVATFATAERDLVIHVYPFRRLGPGEFHARFRETLLREFVAPGLREARLAAPAKIEDFSVEGADASLIGNFREDHHERRRLAIFAAGGVAIVDITANDAAAVEKHASAVKEMLESLSVGQPKARAAPPPILSTPEVVAVPAAPVAPAAPAAAAAPQAAAPAPLPAFIPGMYVGNVRRLIPSFVGGVESGGMWVNGPQYYLLSGDGLAYRTYEQPRTPGGDLGRFDWKRMQQSDAANTGTYEVAGNGLTLRLGNETISAKLAGPGRFEIFGNFFKRTAAK
jgi:hypothetical protein